MTPRLPQLEIPGTFVRLGLMRDTALGDVGSAYALSRSPASARRGAAYNLTLLTTLAMAGVLSVLAGWAWKVLAASLLLSCAVAIAVDPDPLARKLSLSDLWPQLRAYLECAVRWLGDTVGSFALMFAAFVFLAPYAVAAHLWHATAFWVAYGGWCAIRIAYFCRHLFRLRDRWAAYEAPFIVHKANFRTPERARRHLVWSLFMGNIGIAFRCGRQLALLALFQLVAGPLPELVAARIPYGWVIGLVMLGAVFYRYGTVVGPMYYKIHRSLHRSPSLYAGLHKIHHKSVVPTLLDTGTESPAELALTEYTGGVHLLWPSWMFVAIEALFAKDQMESHHARWLPEGRIDAHVGHHFYVSYNFACTMAEPQETRYEAAPGRARRTEDCAEAAE